MTEMNPGDARDAVILDLPIAAISVGNRLRDADQEAVKRIAASMNEIQQISPIEVMEDQDGRYHLVAGLHRLEAAKLNNEQTIRAVLFGGDEFTAKLREIDENLHRAELSAYDEATFLTARYNLWASEKAAKAWGGDRRSSKWRDQIGQAVHVEKTSGKTKFYAETAAALGVSEKTIIRALDRRKKLASFWGDIRTTAAAKNGAALDALSKLRGDCLKKVMGHILDGETIEDAVAMERVPRKAPDSKSRTPKQNLKSIILLWQTLPERERGLFLAEIGAELRSDLPLQVRKGGRQ